MRCSLALIALLAGCTARSSDHQGTFVGNPGKMDVGVSGVPTDLTLDTADFAAESLTLEACDDTEARLALGDFDALGGREDAVEIPGGEFCRATLIPAGVDPLILTGTTAAGTGFTAVIDPGILVLSEVFRVDETELLWDLPLDALDPAAIDALGDGAVIEPTDLLALEVATVVADGAAVYEDIDEDGLLGVEDPLLGVVDGTRAALDGAPAYASSADAGCSCTQGSRGTPWLFLPLILGIRRRRAR